MKGMRCRAGVKSAAYARAAAVFCLWCSNQSGAMFQERHMAAQSAKR